MKSRVLCVASEPIGPRLAGPAIRILELAGSLRRAGHVPVVVAPEILEGAPPVEFPLVDLGRHTGRTMKAMLREADAILIHPQAVFQHPVIRRSECPVIVDLYDPWILESLELDVEKSRSKREFAARTQVAILHDVLWRGDVFLCASERQRDLWLGALLGVGRIGPMMAGRDASPGSLIEVVPFGLPACPPVRPPSASPVLKGVGPIGASDKAILWGGGIWNWLDPLTLIRALARLSDTTDDVHLVFMGGAHPSKEVPTMRMAAQARALAESLGLAGRRVHFREGWVPYAERSLYLLEADAGVTTHRPHLEARYSFRTRVLDYIWAGLPVVCTRGDVISELVEQEGLGVAVPEEDEAALADALRRVLDDAAFAARCRERTQAVARRLTWDQVAEPLVRFCEDPRVAHDRKKSAFENSRRMATVAGRAVELVKQGGAGALVRQAWRHLRLHRR